MRRFTKDDLYCIAIFVFAFAVLYFLLWLGSGEMETKYLIYEMGEETYQEIRATLIQQKGIVPSDAQIANYYVQSFK